MRANLCLHVDAHKASWEEVRDCPTPEPTDTWCPVPHADLVGGVVKTLQATGLEVVTAAYGLTRSGNRFFGLLQVANDDADFGLVVGVRNSHDKSFPAAPAMGAQVFVCDNLSFSGEVKLARKHTSRIKDDLPQLTARAVGLLGDLRATQANRFGGYKSVEVSDVVAHDLVIRALDHDVIGCKAVPHVLEEYRKPRHEEFKARTAWSLFNAFTEVLKGNLTDLPRRSQALHGIFDAHCGVVVYGSTLKVGEDAEIQVANAV